MKTFKSVPEILDFAIGEEEAAAAFYQKLSREMKQLWMKEIFIQFSKEEEGHKKKLQQIKSGSAKSLPQGKVLDLKIGEYLVDAAPTPDMDYQQALILAMKKEKVAFRMYSDLAAVAQSAEVKDILLGLAQEEAKHKLRFEIEYDEVVLKEN